MLDAIAFAAGLVLVLDVPSRQQLTYRMVGRDALPNAIALNSSVFNASRILGPAAAGIVYGIGGAGICFLVNAISFLAVLLGLFAMRTRDFFELEEFERPSILRGTLEGLAYVRRQPRMLILLGLTVMLSTFCFNFNVTLPLLADHTLHASAVVYGLLSAVFGAGALVGALTAAALGRASTKVMLIGSLVFTASELALAPVHGAILAGVLLFFVGAGFAAWSANSNTSMQLAAPDRLRGRIIGIYFYAFNGTGPIGGVLTGWLIAKGGTELAFLIGGILGLARPPSPPSSCADGRRSWRSAACGCRFAARRRLRGAREGASGPREGTLPPRQYRTIAFELTTSLQPEETDAGRREGGRRGSRAVQEECEGARARVPRVGGRRASPRGSCSANARASGSS